MPGGSRAPATDEPGTRNVLRRATPNANSVRCRWVALGASLLILVFGSAAAVATVRFVPIGAWLIDALERRFPPTQLPERVDGIVAISGEWFGERTKPLVMLSKKYPDAKVLYSGSAGHQNPVQRFGHFGGDTARLLVEGKSEDTCQNAQFSAEVVKPQLEQQWLLITSAYHMPRAVGCFRHAGFRVQAFPVDYLHPQARYGFAHEAKNWSQLKFALREWAALTAYWLLGRTDALFPGPR